MMETIDDIKKCYTFKYEDFSKDSPSLINLMNFTLFEIDTKPYKFEEKIENLKNIIKEGKNKDTKVIEECSKQLNDIKVAIDEIMKKVNECKDSSEEMLNDLYSKYDYYLEKPEALETFNRIVNSIINENAKTLIKFVKKLLNYNDSLLDINKKLNIN